MPTPDGPAVAPARPAGPSPPAPPTLAAAALDAADVLAGLGSSPAGLPDAEVARRRARLGPNAVRTHHTRAWEVLWRQVRSPLLLLLVVTATASFFLGQRTDAVIIGVIVAASVGLGFANEYRAERAAQALHSRIRHRSVVVRAGRRRSVDVTELVPGDVVRLALGEVVPADLRLLSVKELECDEAALTGESAPVERRSRRCRRPPSLRT